MDAVLETVRNYRRHPAMSAEQRRAEYGTYRPKVARASLIAAQRSQPKPADARSSPLADVQGPPPATGDQEYEQEPVSDPSIPVPSQGNGGTIPPRRPPRQHVTYQPQRSVWKVFFGALSGLITALFLLYTIMFLLVSGWITASNAWQYGKTHTASTQAMINGQATTIVTSTIETTIYITLIGKGGQAKTYAGPTLDPNAWGGDPAGVVATATVGNGPTPTITVSLIGEVNYLRPFFTRPQMKFFLIPDKQAGYTIVQL